MNGLRGMVQGMQPLAGAQPARSDGLPAYGLFMAALASAGLPIYIHAPKFYVDSYGVGLGTLGGVLFALRLIDFVQDPFRAGWRGPPGRGGARLWPWRG